MALICESKLRELLRGSDSKTFEIGEKDIITPQAKEYLNDLKIRLVRKNGSNSGMSKAASGKKPEDKTHLRGTELVGKDNEVIIFRGKLDSLQSEILLAQCRLNSLGRNDFVQTLQKTLDFARAIMQAEVRNNEFKEWGFLGLQSAEIRDMSHYPEKHFGVKHIMPDHSMGEEILLVNRLRSMTRETEIAAVKAFAGKRMDLIEALNRLSSFYYICMIKTYSERNK